MTGQDNHSGLLPKEEFPLLGCPFRQTLADPVAMLCIIHIVFSMCKLARILACSA